VGTLQTLTLTPALGTATYTLSVRDPWGASASDTVSVTAADTTPPALALSAPAVGAQVTSRVARLVMERTDHVLIVGAGALRFAKAQKRSSGKKFSESDSWQ